MLSLWIILSFLSALSVVTKCSKLSIAARKNALLLNVAESPIFPEWVDKDFPTRVSSIFIGKEEEESMILARRVFYLLRTTWFLEDLCSKKGENNCSGYRRYPYEMAAILGLIDWDMSILFMKANNLDRILTGISNDSTAELTRYVNSSWGKIEGQRYMSMHAFELLTRKRNIVDYIPLGMALLPLGVQTFLRLGETIDPLIGIIQPSQVYPNKLNKSFNLMILNFKYDYLNAPFDQLDTKIEFKDVSLDDLVSKKCFVDKDEKKNDFVMTLQLYKSYRSILSEEEAKIELKKDDIHNLNDALDALKNNSLRLDLTPLSFSYTRYWKSSIRRMSDNDALKLNFDFDFKESPIEIEGVPLEALKDSVRKYVNKIPVKEVIYATRDKFADIMKKNDRQEIQLLLERLKYIYRNTSTLQKFRSEKLALFAWGLSAVFGLADWDVVIGKWQGLFLKLKENGSFYPSARAFTNWFGESLFEKLDESSQDLQGVAVLNQIETVIWISFNLLERCSSDRETTIIVESLKILISLHTTIMVPLDNLFMNLVDLLPLDRAAWVGRSSPDHATTLVIVPYFDKKNHQKVYDMKIFNTGSGSWLHQTVDSINRLHYAEYKEVPLALISIESACFNLVEKDTTAISKGFNISQFAWLLYPDEAFRADYTNNSHSLFDHRKDLFKSQNKGTCAARSLMALMKSELGYKNYKKWKTLIGISMLEAFPLSLNLKKDVIFLNAMDQFMAFVPNLLERKIEKYKARNILEDFLIESFKSAIPLSLKKTKAKFANNASLVLNGECSFDYETSISGSFFLMKNHKMNPIFTVKIVKAEDAGNSFVLSVNLLDRIGERTNAATKSSLTFSVEKPDSITIYKYSKEAWVNIGDFITVSYRSSPMKQYLSCKFRVEKVELPKYLLVN